jgi:rubrerythrin
MGERRPDERSPEEQMAIAEHATSLKRKKLSERVVLAVIFLGTVSAAFLTILNQDLLPGAGYALIIGVGFLLLMGLGCFQFINWRCPRCRHQFSGQRNPRFCSNCGVRLRE